MVSKHWQVSSIAVRYFTKWQVLDEVTQAGVCSNYSIISACWSYWLWLVSDDWFDKVAMYSRRCLLFPQTFSSYFVSSNGCPSLAVDCWTLWLFQFVYVVSCDLAFNNSRYFSILLFIFYQASTDDTVMWLTNLNRWKVLQLFIILISCLSKRLWLS